jgi:hypothetical protein
MGNSPPLDRRQFLLQGVVPAATLGINGKGRYQRRFLFKAAPTAVATAAVSGRPHLASGTDVSRAYTPTFFSAADGAFSAPKI